MNNAGLLLPAHPIQKRKRWPIFRKNDIPRHIRWIIGRYGLQKNLTSLCEIQRQLCGSEIYWEYLERPWKYILTSKDNLYQRIMSEIDKK